jgi:hypothetical protein
MADGLEGDDDPFRKQADFREGIAGQTEFSNEA